MKNNIRLLRLSLYFTQFMLPRFVTCKAYNVQIVHVRKEVLHSDTMAECHCDDVIMSAMASQITSLTTVYSTVYLRRRSKKTPKLRVAGLCVGNSPVIGEFPAQRASNAENVSIWWRHHGHYWPFYQTGEDIVAPGHPSFPRPLAPSDTLTQWGTSHFY